MNSVSAIFLTLLTTAQSSWIPAVLKEGDNGLEKGGDALVVDREYQLTSALTKTNDVVTEVANVRVYPEQGGEGAPKMVSDNAVGQVKSNDVCYGDLGCFSMDSPWKSGSRWLPTPDSPEQIQTRFYLHTSREQTRFNLSTSNTDFNAIGSDFNGSRQTYFIIHGYDSDGSTTWVRAMRDAILKQYDANVILVDWGKGASVLNYFQAASNTRVVGATLVKLGKYLIDQLGAESSRINLIGHSLGAHIASYMGKGIPGVAGLYALDPAQMGFEGYDKQVGLDKSDAKFVQVVHTSAVLFIPMFGLGMVKPHGHVDLYVNGGWNQPDCNLSPSNSSLFGDIAALPGEVISNYMTCAHWKAHEYFTASIEMRDNCTFWGHKAVLSESIFTVLTDGKLDARIMSDCKCDGPDHCSPLGFEGVRYPGRGIFDVTTTADKPFCIPDPTSDRNMANFRSNE